MVNKRYFVCDEDALRPKNVVRKHNGPEAGANSGGVIYLSLNIAIIPP